MTLTQVHLESPSEGGEAKRISPPGRTTTKKRVSRRRSAHNNDGHLLDHQDRRSAGHEARQLGGPHRLRCRREDGGRHSAVRHGQRARRQGGCQARSEEGAGGTWVDRGADWHVPRWYAAGGSQVGHRALRSRQCDQARRLQEGFDDGYALQADGEHQQLSRRVHQAGCGQARPLPGGRPRTRPAAGPPAPPHDASLPPPPRSSSPRRRSTSTRTRT